MANHFFGKHITPSCQYCHLGEKAADGETILCAKKGIVSPLNSCRRFSYDPLKRIPTVMPDLPTYSEADFSLTSNHE